jgi:WD40 repeat protein
LLGGSGIAISPDGHWLVTGCEDHIIRLWNLRSENPTGDLRRLIGHESEIHDAVFSPDSQWLVTADRDRATRIWDMSRGGLPGHQHPIHAKSGVSEVAICGNGRWLMTRIDEHPLELKDLSAEELESFDAIVLPGSESEKIAGVSPDGKWLLTTRPNGSVRLWDLKTVDTSPESIILHGHDGTIRVFAFNLSGRFLATAGDDQIIRIWDLSDNMETASSFDVLETGEITNVQIGPKGRWLVASSYGQLDERGSYGSRTRLYDLDALRSGASDSLPLQRVGGRCSSLAFTSNQRWMMTAFEEHPPSGPAPETLNQLVSLWDLNNMDPGPVTLTGDVFNGALSANVRLSPDDRWLAVVDGAHVRLLDLLDERPGRKPALLHSPGETITSIVFSHNSDLLATATYDGTIRLWNLAGETQENQPVTFRGHDRSISQTVFSPDDRLLVTASHDETIRIWYLDSEMDATNAVVLPIDSVPTALAVTPDGRWLIAHDSEFVWRWSLGFDELLGQARRLAGRNLTTDEQAAFILTP